MSECIEVFEIAAMNFANKEKCVLASVRQHSNVNGENGEIPALPVTSATE